MRKVIDGLIIRDAPMGESDKLLTLLTADEGKIFITAKGARSIKSKVVSMCRLFTYANFEYYEKNGRRWLAGGSVIDSFFGLNQDIEGFALAAYVLQIADEISDEGVDCKDTLQMTLNTLYAIEKRLKPYKQIKAVYELMAVAVSGLYPDLSGCSRCGCENMGELWLDVMNGNLICAECQRSRGGSMPIPDVDAYETRNILVPLDSSALAAARYVLSAPPKKIFSFGLEGDSLELFSKATETYMLNHLERDFDTLHFYHSVK